MNVTKNKWGILCDGTKVNLWTVSNDKMSFSVTDYGCTLTSIVVNDKNGKKTDCLLGFSTLEGYLNTKFCFGAIVGRFANRIGKACFTLNDVKYPLDKNDGPNTLHGGFDGYDKMMWTGKAVETKKQVGVKFTRVSPDGEQGFPGNCKIEVSYLLDEDNNLTCKYTAETDKATPINITNHAYFNLSGKGTIEDHTAKFFSKYILDVDSKLIPNGKFVDVKGTAFDFNKEKKIGKDIKDTGVGYDHCYVTQAYVKGGCANPLDENKVVKFGEVVSPETGIKMTVSTNLEGCQFYTGNYIGGIVGKNGTVYARHDAFCLETQAFPDTPNKKDFPSCILQPGQKYKAKTVYSFE